ncbi:MAG: hypothetical protein V3S38_02650, partial [Acidimicrobiia bacterium]
ADGVLQCEEHGVIPGDPGDGGVVPPGEWTGPRYVYVTTDAVVGECHYWSRIPGGLDSWDPGDDPAVIAANALPVCPGVVTPPVDVPGTAWSIFRSWDLDPPDIGLQPPDRGITGLPTFLASPVPTSIAHTETLPDGRVLQVRAEVEVLRVDWGDGAWGSYDPRGALPYPAGIVTHTYRTKTCPPEYRETHPSGGLCHPTLEFYTIIALYRWVGEYNVGGGWIQIGTLDRTVSQPYDLDEVRGVPVPVP